MAISLIEHNGMLTNKIVGTFNEDNAPKEGFAALFPRETTPSFFVDVRVKRGTRRIAEDVLLFTEGNKAKATKLTEHIYQPPFYREEYDFVRDEVYMRALELDAFTNPTANRMIAQNAIDVLRDNRYAIERAILKQMAQVLQTGIVTLKNGDNIDYRRKAASIVNVSTSGGYWSASTTATPLANIAAGGLFLRNTGKSGGNILNLIGGSSAIQALLATDEVKQLADIRYIERVNVGFPEYNDSIGFTYNGQIAAGDFRINLWSYDDMYDDSNGTGQYFLDQNKVILLPSDFRGKTVFGGLPDMVDRTVGGVSTKIPAVKEAEFLLRGYYDEKTISSTLELTSRPLVVPFTIDKIYTMQVLA